MAALDFFTCLHRRRNERYEIPGAGGVDDNGRFEGREGQLRNAHRHGFLQRGPSSYERPRGSYCSDARYTSSAKALTFIPVKGVPCENEGGVNVKEEALVGPNSTERKMWILHG